MVPAAMKGRFGLALVVGFLVGAAGALVALSREPAVRLPHVKPITSTEVGRVVESFFSRAPEDALTLTHSGKPPFAVFPSRVALLSEPVVERGLALIVRVRNAAEEVIGYASELEVHPAGKAFADDIVWDTDWTVVIPGRGALFLHQKEHSGELGSKALKPMLATRQEWRGDVTAQTTVGPQSDGRGTIIGGTGDFAGAAGSFVEIDHITRLTPQGAIEGDFELRVSREVR